MTAVLVVDDDPNICKMMSEILSVNGYNAQTAEHGGLALDAVEEAEHQLTG